MNQLVDSEMTGLKSTMAEIVDKGKTGALNALGRSRNKGNKEDLNAVLKAASNFSRLYASETNRIQTAIVTAKMTNDASLVDDVFEALSGRRPDNANALEAPKDGAHSGGEQSEGQ